MLLLDMNPLGYQAEPTYFKNTDIIKRLLSASNSFKNNAALKPEIRYEAVAP